jgi:hypothetical protein
MKKQLFEAVNTPNSQTITFSKSLLRLNYAPGSKGSMKFLESLNKIPATNSIFSTKVIDKILKYKFYRVRHVAIFNLCLYLTYLTCIFWKSHDDKRFLAPWPIIHGIIELIQYIAYA